MPTDTQRAITGHGADPTRDAAATVWPLADSDQFAATDPEWRARQLAWFTGGLDRHVIRAWFPHCVDTEAGGFFCDFDARWRLRGPQARSLEFQARQTRTVARLAIAFPSQQRWRDWALHGLSYLSDVMRDPLEGGWFWQVGRDGTPGHGHTKHTHGMSYLLGCFGQVYAATGSEDARRLGLEAFEWLEDHARDPVDGGYFGWMVRDGRPIRTAADKPDPALWEPLGQGIGLKDLNVHTDLLQGLVWLYEVTSDSRVEQRIVECSDLIVDRFMTKAGALHYMVHPDWVPVPAPERYGYHLQAGYRLPHAAASIGRSVAGALEVARLLADHAIEVGWREGRGGFIDAGPGDAPFRLGDASLLVTRRPWWVQAEGLQCLVTLALLGGKDDRYLTVADELIKVVDRDLVDKRHGGWRELASDSRGLFRRFTARRPKGTMWKDASHEADAYLVCMRSLRGLPAGASLES